LKIDDTTFTNLPALPYAVKSTILDVGTSVFALGYPMSNTLGEELKVTDGIISSKTGYQGDIVTYQISAPIQPGNSGGPMFDKEGNLVGITSAGIPGAENVGYSIKSSYLYQLMDAAPITIEDIADKSPKQNTFTELIKEFAPYVVMILIY
jgi:S1-C subfamily serine protease